MQHTRKRLIGMAMLFLALLASVSVTQARWSSGDIGFANMERVCRDGAIVSMLSDVGPSATGFAGARRHDNLAAAPEPEKAFGGTGTPRPLDDFGPNIVADPAIRPLNISAQDLAREVPVVVITGTVAPNLVHNYGSVILPWSSPQPVGTPVVLVYRRDDNLDVGIAEEIVADCLISDGITQEIATTVLPGRNSAIPSAQLHYQIAGWPKYGLLLRDGQPLDPGTRFSTADLVGHPLSYTTSHTPTVDALPITVTGIDLVSQFPDRLLKNTGTNIALNPTISRDGRYVAFESRSTSLVSGDTNTVYDIFVYDRQTKQTTRVSGSSSSAQSDGNSSDAAISADGRFVAYDTEPNSFVEGEASVFLYDRQTGQTTRISVNSKRIQANRGSGRPSISGDGRYVAFATGATNLLGKDTNGEYSDIFVYDRLSGQTTLGVVAPDGSQPNYGADSPSISGDGHLIAFRSDATNLLAAGEDTNGISDIFVYNRLTGKTIRASVTSDGAQSIYQGGAGKTIPVTSQPAISADGSTVAFASSATNLGPIKPTFYVDDNIYLHNLQTGKTILASHGPDPSRGGGFSYAPALSGDGRFVVYTGDLGSFALLYDLQNDSTIPLASTMGLNVAISIDGRFTAFSSGDGNLLPNPILSAGDIFVAYRATTDMIVGTPYQVYSPLINR